MAKDDRDEEIERVMRDLMALPKAQQFGFICLIRYLTMVGELRRLEGRTRKELAAWWDDEGLRVD